MGSPSDHSAEVSALVEATRLLTSRAFLLSRSINETVEELQEFTDDLRRGRPQEFHERRVQRLPYEGEDRRA